MSGLSEHFLGLRNANSGETALPCGHRRQDPLKAHHIAASGLLLDIVLHRHLNGLVYQSFADCSAEPAFSDVVQHLPKLMHRLELRCLLATSHGRLCDPSKSQRAQDQMA
jgi:hypothetical protein